MSYYNAYGVMDWGNVSRTLKEMKGDEEKKQL